MKKLKPHPEANVKHIFELDPGPPGRWEVTILGWHPAPLNQLLGNRFKRHRLKTADALMLGSHLKSAGVHAAAGRRKVRYTLVFAKGQRACDPDAYDKSLLDALQTCRAITNDNIQAVDADKPDFERPGVSRHATRIIIEDLV